LNYRIYASLCQSSYLSIVGRFRCKNLSFCGKLIRVRGSLDD